MKKILVLGGTRFFGKKMVQKLVESGYGVTVATRGRTVDELGDQVQRVVLDRENPEQMKAALRDAQYDVVYDQICYSPDDAQMAVELFAGRVGRYIFTSSMAVYGGNEDAWDESGFDPYTYPVQLGGKHDFTYGEGKRLAEAVFLQKASFPVVAVRFPVVVGEDDYTRRVEFHIERMQNGTPIGFLNPQAKTCLIDSDEAGAFLAWLAEADIEGPVNACADGVLRWSEFFALLEEVTGKPAVLVQEAEQKDVSPYSQATSRYLSTEKAKRAGFVFRNLLDWFPGLLRKLV